MNTGLVAQDTQLFGKVRRKQSLFASTFHINVIILPRQARDKHRGKPALNKEPFSRSLQSPEALRNECLRCWTPFPRSTWTLGSSCARKTSRVFIAAEETPFRYHSLLVKHGLICQDRLGTVARGNQILTTNNLSFFRRDISPGECHVCLSDAPRR
jgi:hypothetical protein